MKPRNARIIATLSLSSLLSLAACGPDKPADAPTGAQTSGANSAGGAQPAAKDAPVADAAGKARFDAAKATPLATPVADAKADDKLGHGLVDTAAWIDKTLAPEGGFFKVTLAEKGKAHVDVTLKPGKCYVFVGFANLATIVDYDMAILKAPGVVVAEDDDDDSTPTIAKPVFCPTEEAAYTVELKSDKGAGEAAFQVFSKAK
jgi:hypothetical protein